MGLASKRDTDTTQRDMAMFEDEVRLNLDDGTLRRLGLG
jgi:hypothetical protein